MKFRLIRYDKLKVQLSCLDMKNLSLSYADMDYSDEITREAMLLLLDKAKAATGFDASDSRLFIEVYPDGEGCVIYFTAINTDRPLTGLHREGYSVEPAVFEFDDIDILITAAAKLFKKLCHRIYKSSLYRYKDKYRLIVLPLDYLDRLSVGFLCEYGDKIGEGEVLAAFTEEHGEPLLVENAIDAIAEYML